MAKETLYQDDDFTATKDWFLRMMVNQGLCLDYDDAEEQFNICLKEGTIWRIKQ